MDTPEGTPKITIDEFAKVELRVATIKAAEPHPKADRLLVLKIPRNWSANKSWSWRTYNPPCCAALKAKGCSSPLLMARK
jgi:hypothetical protein